MVIPQLLFARQQAELEFVYSLSSCEDRDWLRMLELGIGFRFDVVASCREPKKAQVGVGKPRLELGQRIDGFRTAARLQTERITQMPPSKAKRSGT